MQKVNQDSSLKQQEFFQRQLGKQQQALNGFGDKLDHIYDVLHSVI